MLKSLTQRWYKLVLTCLYGHTLCEHVTGMAVLNSAQPSGHLTGLVPCFSPDSGYQPFFAFWRCPLVSGLVFSSRLSIFFPVYPWSLPGPVKSAHKMHGRIHFVCTHAIKHKETSKTSVAHVREGKTFRRLLSVVFRVKYWQ
jgi:hypothetical protein